jgi:hypothetical protein
MSGSPLNEGEKGWFRDTVLANEDCCKLFFELFLPGGGPYSSKEFLSWGIPVRWMDVSAVDSATSPCPCSSRGTKRVLLESSDGKRRRLLCSEDDFQAVLYGLRLWARDELEIIDEVAGQTGVNLMFPVGAGAGEKGIIGTLLRGGHTEGTDWIVVSLRESVKEVCPQEKISVSRLFDLVRRLKSDYPGLVSFVPTSRDFATISAVSRKGTWSPSVARYQLRGYLQDREGRHVSHVRFHRQLEEVLGLGPTTPSASAFA